MSNSSAETGFSSQNSTSTATSTSDSVGINPFISQWMDRFAGRRRWLLFFRGVAAFLITLILCSLVIVLIDYSWLMSDGSRWALSLMMYFAAFYFAFRCGWWQMRRPDRLRLAREVETAYPSLNEDLLSAIELADPDAKGSRQFRQLSQERAVRQVERLEPSKLLPWARIGRWLILAVCSAAVVGVLMLVPPLEMGRRMARVLLPGIQVERASITKIEILRPNPPNLDVAHGDAVGVVASVLRVGSAPVLLQWRSGGESGVVDMSARQAEVDSDSFRNRPKQEEESNDLNRDGEYAGNLVVEEQPLQYRVLAGDAVSLWYELTPRPRPRITRIDRRYRYPDYAGIPDLDVPGVDPLLAEPNTETGKKNQSTATTEPTGNLEAIVGTTATVTAHFDQPVRDAVVRLGEGTSQMQMEPVEGSESVFQVRIPIQHSTTYQLDAVSIESGLNQPFGQAYSIVPRPDNPPSVRWAADSESDAEGRIVGALDVIKLAVDVADDLPIDNLIQEIQVDNAPLLVERLDADGGKRDINHRWEWDLLNLNKRNVTLSPGDLVRTRIVAQDRRGQQGESEWAEFLIADEGFQIDRHKTLADTIDLARKIDDSLRKEIDLAKELEDVLGGKKSPPDSKWFEKLAEWQSELEERRKSFEQLVRQSGTIDFAIFWERLSHWSDEGSDKLINIANTLEELSEKDFEGATGKRVLQKQYSQARSLRGDASSRRSLLTGLVGCRVSYARLDDAIKLRDSLAPLVNAEKLLPMDRYPRYINLATARLVELRDIGSDAGDLIPSRTISQMRSFSQWAERWFAKLRNNVADGKNERTIRGDVMRFEIELGNQIAHSLFDQGLTATITSKSAEQRKKSMLLAESIRIAGKAGREAQRSKELAEKSDDAEKVIEERRKAAEQRLVFQSTIENIQSRLLRDATLSRKMPVVDLRHAADLQLISRALNHLTRQGYSDYKDTPAQTIYEELEPAVGILMAAGEMNRNGAILDLLAKQEASLLPNATSKIDQPLRAEYFRSAVGSNVGEFRKRKVNHELTRKLEQTYFNEQASRLRTVVTARQWSGVPKKDSPIVSAASASAELRKQYQLGAAELAPSIENARKIVEKYIETISELAERAAQQTEVAQETLADEMNQDPTETDDSDPNQAADRNEDGSKPADPSVSEQLAAERLSGETVQALIDRANNTDILMDQAGDEIRDADAASAIIAKAREEAIAARQEDSEAAQKLDEADSEKSKQDASRLRKQTQEKRDQKLEALKSALRQVAEHFEASQEGQDVSASRQQLRDDAETIASEIALEEQRRQMEALAETLQSSPEEILKQLEERLGNDPVMQEELSDIAQRAADAATASLEDAAERQQRLRKDLERSDESLAEQKRRLRQQLQDLTNRASDVEKSLMSKARSASQSAVETDKTKGEKEAAAKAGEEARQAIAQAITSVQQTNDDSVLADMQQAANEVAKGIDAAKDAIKQFGKSTLQQNEKFDLEDIDNKDRRRATKAVADQQRNRMRQTARRVITDAARDAKRSSDRWKGIERDAQRRASDQKRNLQNEQRNVDRLESNLEKAKDNNQQTENIERELEKANARKAERETLIEEAEKTAAMAKEGREAADQQRKNWEKAEVPSLESDEPSSEFASRIAAAAAKQLTQIADEAKELADESPSKADPQWDQNEGKRLADQENQIGKSVDEAIEDLQRASRHEARMERDNSAQQLQDAVETAQKRAPQAVQESAQAIEDATQSDRDESSDQDPSPQSNAVKKAAEAEQAIRDAAAGVAEQSAQAMSESAMAESSNSNAENEGSENRPDARPPNARPPNARPTAQQQAAEEESRQAARQLDELDRGVFQQQQSAAEGQSAEGENSEGQQGEQGDGQQGQKGDGQEGQQGQNSQQGKNAQQGEGQSSQGNPTAGDVSPSLSSGMDQMQQSAAKTRQQRLDEANQGDSEEGQDQPQMPQSQGDSGQPGKGDSADGGSVSIDGIDRIGDDWGQLRDRTQVDRNESTRVKVPAQYRKQLQAYFREVAKRSSKSENDK